MRCSGFQSNNLATPLGVRNTLLLCVLPCWLPMPGRLPGWLPVRIAFTPDCLSPTATPPALAVTSPPHKGLVCWACAPPARPPVTAGGSPGAVCVCVRACPCLLARKSQSYTRVNRPSSCREDSIVSMIMPRGSGMMPPAWRPRSAVGPP